MGAGVSSSNVRLITFDFFDGGPCLDVGRISRVRVFVVTVAIAATVTPVVRISPAVVLIAARVASVVAVTVTAVVAAAVRVVTSRRTLALGITTGRQNPYGLRVWVCRVRVGVVIEPPA